MQVWTKPQSPEIKLQQDTGIVLSGKSSCAGVESPHGWFDYCNHNCHNQTATSSLGNKCAFDTAGMNLLNKISFSAHAESKFGTNALTHTHKRINKGELFFHPISFFLIYRKWKWQDVDTNVDFLMEYHKLQPQERAPGQQGCKLWNHSLLWHKPCQSLIPFHK